MHALRVLTAPGRLLMDRLRVPCAMQVHGLASWDPAIISAAMHATWELGRSKLVLHRI